MPDNSNSGRKQGDKNGGNYDVMPAVLAAAARDVDSDPAPSRHRILLVDNHGIVRAGIRLFLDAQADMQVVGEATTGEEAVVSAQTLRPGVVVADVAVPGIDGVATTSQLKKAVPEVKVLVLTARDDAEFILPVLRAGASGYVLKSSHPDELLFGIRAVGKGDFFVSPSMHKWIFSDIISRNSALPDHYDTLTAREREVLTLAAAGRSNREIAESLVLSTRTVEKYRQGVMFKLGMRRREELTKYALRRGFISLDN